MEGIFTIPYSEYAIINNLNQHFKKQDGFSIFIPTNRQEKGIDFIIMNTNNKKVITVQVKSSRVYFPAITNKKREYQYYLWLSNFIKKYEIGNADYYMIFGSYPVYESNTNIGAKYKFWKEIILCYSEKDMFNLLKNVKTKQGKPNSFFDFGFNNEDDICSVRGLDKPLKSRKHLLLNQLDNIKRKLL
jgi:hypothetical protein